MHVVIIAGHGPSLVRFRGPLITAMLRAGHRVTALAPPDEHTDTAEAVRGLGAAFETVPLARRSRNPLADLRSYAALVRTLKRLQPDAVLSYTIKPVIWGSLAARRAGVRRVYALVTGLGRAFATDRDTGRPDRALLSHLARGLGRKGLRRLVQGLYRRALKGCHTVFFQNAEDETLFRERGILAPDKPSMVLPGSGVDLAEYAAEPPSPESGPPTFLCLARLLADKGLREYQAAAVRLRGLFPRVRFLLAGPVEAGPGALKPDQVAGWADAHGSGGVEYLGELDDVRPALARATVFVLPSYYGEGLPRSILEAMAMSRPIVTTDHPGCRETVIPGGNGFLVPPRDPEALATALERFIENPELARDMGRASRELAGERFDVRLVNRMIMQAMELV